MTPSTPPIQPASAPTAVSVTPCVHRWRLGRPVDGKCTGICAHCGAIRDYPAGFTAPRAGAMVIAPRG